jgi:hypothetical protein
MKSVALIIVHFIIITNNAVAQPIYSSINQGNIWLMLDSIGLNFNYSPPKPFNTVTTNQDYALATLCDSFGNLKYFDKVDNGFNQIVMNRDSQWIQSSTNLLGNDWSITWFLPFTGTSITGYVTSETDYRSHHFGMSRFIYNQIVDSINQGKGGWFGSMNRIISDFDSIRLWSGSPVRHANGRDWWVASHRHGDDTLFVMLATPDTMIMVHRLKIGTNNSIYSLSPGSGASVGAMIFSQDGSSLLNVNGEGLVEVYDFDRCSGLVSNAHQIEAPLVINGVEKRWMYSACFSPSGRYIYTCQIDPSTEIFELVQYDLFNSIPKQTRTVLYSNNGNQGSLVYIRLGPDGKIYLPPLCNSSIGCFPLDSTKLSVILFPDSGGLACQFIPNYLDMGKRVTVNLLSMAPNYDLGPIDGSPCDTLNIDTRPPDPDTILHISNLLWPEGLKVYPNPVQTRLTLESTGTIRIQSCVLYDIQGRPVMREQLDNEEMKWELPVQALPPGQYVLEVFTQQGVFRRAVTVMRE